MAEEPPYLSVDTDVSAKYKGAFCEAKIRKVVRSVKCKVVFKQGWGSATIPDDQIRGALRIGAVVEAKHPEKKEFAEATITKIQDCSQYTVVFDDGDITTLRRTALCLKSGRHFAESDTLDQLPLTHPEHFSNPVIGGRRGRRRLDENSEDEELLLISGAELEDEREEHIGRVVCVEGSEKKKQKDNWFPGLVVAPTAQDNVPIHVKEEYLVRSFKDGRYYTVPKKEANEFTREVGARVEHPTLKAAVDKALLYLDCNELPPHWDRDLLLYGLGDVASTDNDAGLDYESSDDEPREEKDHFVAQLYKFMDDSGTPINKGPTIGSRDVDLYKLFKVVQNQGGYNRVTNHNNWKLVALKMGFGQVPITVNLVKIAYKKFLFTFEEFYRKLGCTLLNHPSRLSRSCCRGGRNLIRNKDSGNSSGSLAKTDAKRQIKDVRNQSDLNLPSGKIRVEKDEYSNQSQTQDEELYVEIPSDGVSKSPTPPPSTSTTTAISQRTKRSTAAAGGSIIASPQSPTLKIHLPVKIKLEQNENSEPASPVQTSPARSASTPPLPPPPPARSGSPSPTQPAAPQQQHNFLQISRPISPATPALLAQAISTPQITSPQQQSPTAQKKEPRARQLKKSTTVENIAASSSNITNNLDNIAPGLECDVQVPPVKEKKRRAAFPRAVVAAKKVKQQHTPRITSPHTPGLAASRTKRAVNKDKLRTIVKNLKSKWVPSSLPGTNNQEMTKVTVKSKTIKEDNITSIKSRKDDTQLHSIVTTEDKKKGGRKRRDKRLSEDRFVPLPSYKTILPGDKLRVYYGPTLESKVTYEAKVLSIRTEGSESVYLVHYTGWNNRYDEWIKTSRIADNLSWIPGRTARKANQTPKTPKRKGSHKNETGGFGIKDNQQPLMTPTPTSSSASSTSSNSSTTMSKSNVASLINSGFRKTSTRASTRAAAIRKEIPTTESNTEYDSDTNIESELTKKSLMDSKSNNESDKKSFGKKRKFEEISKSDANLPINLEIEDSDEESMNHSRNTEHVDNDENSEEHDLKSLKSDAIKTAETVSENDSCNNNSNGGNNLGNVIIVDVELKNESEEDSLVIDENQEIDESEVIEGYSSVASTDSKPDSKLHPTHQTGRDFDLTQIRSELKGIETNVTRPDDIEDLNLEESNTLDIYEFKEPEFDTTTTCKLEDKNKTRNNIVVRMFSDVINNVAINQKESKSNESRIDIDESNNTTGTTYSVHNTSADSLSDERPILKTCEEAFDRVCAEPLRAATERPPAGFLFMDEEEDEEDVYDDDDSQDRLIISERDSDNEIPAEMSIDLPPTDLNEQSTSIQKEELESKSIATLDAECVKEVISRGDDEEDLEDELLNVAIQRAIESSEDTTDGEILSRHLAPRHMFAADTFSPVLDVDNNKIQHDSDTDNIIKISMLPTNHHESPASTEDAIKETNRSTASESQLLQQNSALDLSNASEVIQTDSVELLTQDEEMMCEDEVVSQEDAGEPETVIDTLDIESNVGAVGEDEDEDEEDDDLITVEDLASSQGDMPSSQGDMPSSQGDMTSSQVDLASSQGDLACAGGGSSSGGSSARGPHTPPGPAPGTPPDTELDEDYTEQYNENADIDDQYEEVADQEVDRDEQPPLLTREVEVEEESVVRQDVDKEEIACNDEENDETNLVSLLCEETIPGSPQVAVNSDSYQLSPGTNDEESINEVTISKELQDSMADKDIKEKDEQVFVANIVENANNPNSDHQPIGETINNATTNSCRNLQQNSQVINQTPMSSPTSSSSSNNSPTREAIQSPQNEVIQPQASGSNEQYQELCPAVQASTSHEIPKPTVSESIRTRKSDTRSASSKKSRRTRKRSEEVAKRKYRSRHHASDSDDHCESSNRGYQGRSRTPPRLRKYNFSVQLSPEMDHQQRVNHIQNAMGDIRKAYASLKLELASIERRRKKLRRREREFRL